MREETHNSKGSMAKLSHHRLTWSEKHQQYELSTQGYFQRAFQQHDEQTWQEWLSLQASFAFQGRYGHLSIVKEERARGGGYWYAYSTRGRRTQKRYLGKSSAVTFARLEEITHSSFQSDAQEIADTHQAVVCPTGLPDEAPFPLGIPLLATKLSYPRSPAILIERETLHLRLDAALTSALTLLSASAGWGKTTLLSAWAARSSHASA